MQNCQSFFRTDNRPLLSILLLTVLLWGLGVAPAVGQGDDRVTRELEKTDQLIERALKAVDESGSAKGRRLLENAQRFQRKAWEQLDRHRLEQAKRYTLKTREKAMEATAGSRSPEENQYAVQQQLERTNDLLAELTERSNLYAGQKSADRENFNEARLEYLQQRHRSAWDRFHEQRLRLALRITLQVREQAHRFTEKTRRSRFGWQDNDRSLKRVRKLLERAREPVGKSGPAKNRDLMERAERRLAQAEAAIAEGQTSIAREHLRVGHELLTNALAGTERPFEARELKELIAQAQFRADRLEGAVIEAGDQQLREQFRRAQNELRRARALAGRRQRAKALTHARAAVRMLERVQENLPSPDN